MSATAILIIAIAATGILLMRFRKRWLAKITANYAKPLHVEELAKIASMGVSTLHHHLRMLTAMSPLQYQKQLRLQSARSLMLNNGLDAASAAFEVGYESAMRFNREYSRFFGQPPMRDLRALLSPGGPKLELVGSPESSYSRSSCVLSEASANRNGHKMVSRILLRRFPLAPAPFPALRF